MITEDYCDFETAKLLKEKGFDVPCNCYGVYNGVNLTYRLRITDKYTNWNKHTDTFIISCPTLQMAMKWLREVHKLHIEILASYHFRIFDGYSFEVYNIKDAEFVNYSSDKGTFKTYEEAAESSIKYCLENLI